MSEQWRVVDADGAVHEAPTPHPYWATGWRCGNEPRYGYGDYPRDSVVSWARGANIEWREVLEPGQLTKAEAIAAETERCFLVAYTECLYRDRLAAVSKAEADYAREKGGWRSADTICLRIAGSHAAALAWLVRTLPKLG